MITVVFDIETVPDPNVPFDPKPKFKGQVRSGNDDEFFIHPSPPETVELSDANPFPPFACHAIACIGYASFEHAPDGAYRPVAFKTVDGETEREKVEKFLDYIDRPEIRLVGWNSRVFDVPVLHARALKYGISCLCYFKGRFGPRYRYNTDDHVDLIDQLTNFGAAPKCHLDQIARLIGLPGKPPNTDGSSVKDMYARGEHDRIARYCMSDVLQTTIVDVRFQVLTGRLSHQAHDASIRNLYNVIDVDRLPVNYHGLIDWTGLLLSKRPVPSIAEVEREEVR